MNKKKKLCGYLEIKKKYSGLENSTDYMAHGVAKSWTQLSIWGDENSAYIPFGWLDLYFNLLIKKLPIETQKVLVYIFSIFYN